MWLHSISLSLALALTSLVVGCGDDPAAPSRYTSLMTADDGEVGVEVLSDAEELAVGRNLVYYEVTMLSDGSPVTTATVSQSPIMHMMEFSHACPETDPAGANEDGLYPGKIVFTMPSGAEGNWTNEVTVVLDGETTERVIDFGNVTVMGNDRRKTVQWTEEMTDMTGFVTLNPEVPWAVGANAYVMTAHYRQDMMHFPEIADATIAVTVAQGDAAPTPALAPTYDVDGEHLGSLEFPAAGTYTVSATVSKAEVELGTVSWTVEVP